MHDKRTFKCFWCTHVSVSHEKPGRGEVGSKSVPKADYIALKLLKWLKGILPDLVPIAVADLDPLPLGSPCTGSTPSSSIHVWWVGLRSMASAAPHRLVSDLAGPPSTICLLFDTSLTMPGLPSGPCTIVSWTSRRPTIPFSMNFKASVGLLASDWSQPLHAGGCPAPGYSICYWYISDEDRWHSWPASCATHGGAAGLPA